MAGLEIPAECGPGLLALLVLLGLLDGADVFAGLHAEFRTHLGDLGIFRETDINFFHRLPGTEAVAGAGLLFGEFDDHGDFGHIGDDFLDLFLARRVIDRSGEVAALLLENLAEGALAEQTIKIEQCLGLHIAVLADHFRKTAELGIGWPDLRGAFHRACVGDLITLLHGCLRIDEVHVGDRACGFDGGLGLGEIKIL